MFLQQAMPVFLGFALLAAASQAQAENIYISGQEVKSQSDLSKVRYDFYRRMFLNIRPGNVSKRLSVDSIKKRFLFVNENLEFYKNNYIKSDNWPIDLDVSSNSKQLLLAYDIQIETEMFWMYFEKSDFIEKIDIMEKNAFSEEFAKNYDYIVYIRSNFDGKRNAKSIKNRKTEYFIRSTKTGAEMKIAEKLETPILFDRIDDVAMKLSSFTQTQGQGVQ